MPPRLRFSVLVLIGLVAAPALHAAAPDTLRPEPVRFRVAPIFGAFYSPTHGIGVGVRAGVHNLGWQGSVMEVSAEPMQRFGRYGVRLFTGDPYEARLFAGTGLTYTVTNSFNFFGFGPQTHRSDQVRTSMERVEAELRVGGYAPGGHQLLVQPVARLYHDRFRGFELEENLVLSDLDPRSQAMLTRALGNPSTGVAYGLEVIHDLLDRPRYPSRGTMLQAAGRRYDGLGDDPFRYWGGSVVGYGFVPLGRPGFVLEARALGAFTRNAGERPIPFYALPRLDGDLLGGFTRDRFVGHDVLALSAGVRVRLLEAFQLAAVDVAVTGHAANAYDDLFRQLQPGLTFDRDVARSEGRTPLRPSLGLGGYLVDLTGGRAIVSGQIGLSPEGIELVDLRFVYDFRERRPPMR
jgi:hypothetical protein